MFLSDLTNVRYVCHPHDMYNVISIVCALLKEKDLGKDREESILRNGTFYLNGLLCFGVTETFVFNVTATEGEIVLDRRNFERDNTTHIFRLISKQWCRIMITVPDGLKVQATVGEMQPCQGVFPIVTKSRLNSSLPRTFTQIFRCLDKSPSPVFLSFTRQLLVDFPISLHVLKIRFQGVRTDGRKKMPIHMTSPSTGFITSPAYNGINRIPFTMDTTRDLRIPDDHTVMISFQHFAIVPKSQNCERAYVRLYRLPGRESDHVTFWQKCSERFISADIYDDAVVLRIHMFSNMGLNEYLTLKRRLLTGFKMLFSFHSAEDVPTKLSNNWFNCSVSHYSSFQHHLDCNLHKECFEGQDETAACPYSSAACQGKVASQGKCFFYEPAETRLSSASNPRTFVTPGQFCKADGARLAAVRSPAELRDFLKLFQYGKQKSVEVLTGMLYNANDIATPNMYRKMTRGHDKSILYYRVDASLETNAFEGETMHRLYYAYAPFNKFGYAHAAELRRDLDAVCEVDSLAFETHNRSNTVAIRQTLDVLHVISRAKQDLLQCPDGHVTHTVLKCDLGSQCGQNNHVTTCEVRNIITANERLMHTSRTIQEEVIFLHYFECDDSATIPFSLVCDFRVDCRDESDESFCQHPPCAGLFSCGNHQCVTLDERCDAISDCLNNFDELGCIDYRIHRIIWQTAPSQKSIIYLDGNGSFVAQRMQVNESCPETHYGCFGEFEYCLPVYTRCNGYYDCLDREDEQDCEEATCPGFYRCRKSNVCVHPHHLCDGWPQCPQRDDEWLCDVSCPAGCVCVGLTARCPHHASAALGPQIRHLDAMGSGMTPISLTNNRYLIRAVFANCSIAHLDEMNLPNLQFMDLSQNYLTVINLSVFNGLHSLKHLVLSRNPVNLFFHQPTAINKISLKSLDLSFTKLKMFDSKPLSHFVNLQKLTLSHTEIHSISGSSFRLFKKLRELDLANSPVKAFPSAIFRGLTALRKVRSDNYKLCCRDILPAFFDGHCYAPQDDISSCEDLLRTQIYRGILWLVATLSVTGNLFCFFMRVCVLKNATKGSYNVFVTNLCLADLFMGIYMTIVGVADKKFEGQYIHQEETWIRSTPCKLAGFMSLLSSEMSALNIWLITLDRFIVLRFPFTELRFGTISASVACLLSWLICCGMAAVPLFPVLNHWEFYSQSGICIPLPITRRHFPGKGYSFGIMIVFNFILFLFIAVGQAFIYYTVKASSVTSSATRKSRDTTVARRLIIVAMTDFLCWFPISFCGLLAAAKVTIPGEVNVAFATLVLPLNSAFNPFLYTINMVLQKREKLHDERLMELLKERLEDEKAD